MVSALRAGTNDYFVDVMTCVFIKRMELVMMGETINPPAFLSFVLDPETNHLDEAVARDEQEEAILITTEDTIAPRSFPQGKINSAVPGRRGLAQMHRAKHRYRRGNRKGPRQGDPSQYPGP